ncbi:MAG: 50S ribosomal protein L25 [Planctomycetota bacterium]
MSTETVEVQKREATGSISSRKLRQTGHVPAILYGHGEENVNLSVSADSIGKVIQHGSKILSLTGAVTETALLKEVQWDAFGIDVLHVDFTRVSQSEAVEVTLPVELKGEAPGIAQGGKFAFALHELTISCPANAVPENLVVDISGLEMGQSINVGEVALPEGSSVVTNATDVVVQVTIPSSMKGKQAEAADDDVAAEPEVISKGGDSSEEAAE